MMKFLIIGLGNFGAAIAEKLAQKGHEVIGVDKQMEKVEAIKDKITHAICLDCKHEEAVRSLPLKNTDIVMVTIGEDEGANLLITALMKNMNVTRLISRSVSKIHETILEAMGIKEIVRPDEETAERWSNKLTNKNIIESFDLSDDYSIIQALVPDNFVGKTIQELGFNKLFNVIALTIIRDKNEKKLFGRGSETSKIRIQGIATAETTLNKGDIMVLYGHINDIKKLLNQN